MCGFGSQAQITVFKYSDGPLIPQTIRQIYLTNNTWDIGKNDYGEVAILGDVKATLPGLNELIRKNPPEGAQKRNEKLREYSKKRSTEWQNYLNHALNKEPIRAVVVAEALGEILRERQLQRKFVYVHEAVSDAAPFQLYLPFTEPISYYCVEGGSLGWSMPATLGIKLAGRGWQDIDAELVVNAVGDGSALFYPQVWWTGAHHNLPILHIIMNNLEYRTLIQGLGVVIDAYGEAEGYKWRPVTPDPEYLKIKNPDFNFVELAKSFGVQHGQRIRKPQDVKAALERGIDHVIKNKSAYVLELFSDPALAPDQPRAVTALATGAAEPSPVAVVLQPPLDVFYNEEGMRS
jgi:benzoylformate decarboxylase